MAYGIALWGNTSLNYTKKAQVVLNSAARLVTKLPRHTRQKRTNETIELAGHRTHDKVPLYDTNLESNKTQDSKPT